MVLSHARGLPDHTTVFGCYPGGKHEDVRSIYPHAQLFPEAWPCSWFRGKGLRRALVDAAKEFDIIHAHMFWDHPVWAAWQAARRHNTPLVITPHGSVSAPWRYRPLHKRMYRKLVIDHMLNETACVHVLNKAEETACRQFGIVCPVRIIPNGIPKNQYNQERTPGPAEERWPALRDRRVCLYLGRLWSGKGLDILPAAWAKAITKSRKREWLLVLAGPNYRKYETVLRREIKDLGISDQVLLPGPVDGELKDSLLSAADCFVLPSHGEGFSMALLEAMAAGLPSLYTRECNFSELAASGGGKEVAATQEDLTSGLLQIFDMTSTELKSMGRKANKLGVTNYTTESVAERLLKLYANFSGRRPTTHPPKTT